MIPRWARVNQYLTEVVHTETPEKLIRIELDAAFDEGVSPEEYKCLLKWIEHYRELKGWKDDN